MKRFVLIPNVTKDAEYRVTKEAASYLLQRGAVLYAEKRHATHLPGVLSYDGQSIPDPIDALIVFGGDGSMIDAATTALAHNLPMVGINLGKLGYLTYVEPDDLSRLSSLLEDAPAQKNHITLRVCIEHADGSVTERICVNDVTVSRGNTMGMARLSLTDGTPDGVSLEYNGDGLIICTPLGSTAYSLSAGGPIVDSGLEAVCVTPLCVHSFFSRSILFSPQAMLTVKNISAEGIHAFVNVDGRDVYSLASGEKLTVTDSGERLALLSIGHHGVLDALRRKMIFSDAKL